MNFLLNLLSKVASSLGAALLSAWFENQRKRQLEQHERELGGHKSYVESLGDKVNSESEAKDAMEKELDKKDRDTLDW